MSSSTTYIDTLKNVEDRLKVKCFLNRPNNISWNVCTEEGFNTPYDNSTIMIDISSIEDKSFTLFFAWYDEDKKLNDWRSISLENGLVTINDSYYPKNELDSKLDNPPGAVDNQFIGIENGIIKWIDKKISNFENDAGYQTELQLNVAVSGKADKSYVDEKLGKKQDAIKDKSLNYSVIKNPPSIPTVPGNVGAFENDANYISATGGLENQVLTKTSLGAEWKTIDTDVKKKAIEILSSVPASFTAADVNRVFQWNGSKTSTLNPGNFYRIEEKTKTVSEPNPNKIKVTNCESPDNVNRDGIYVNDGTGKYVYEKDSKTYLKYCDTLEYTGHRGYQLVIDYNQDVWYESENPVPEGHSESETVIDINHLKNSGTFKLIIPGPCPGGFQIKFDEVIESKTVTTYEPVLFNPESSNSGSDSGSGNTNFNLADHVDGKTIYFKNDKLTAELSSTQLKDYSSLIIRDDKTPGDKTKNLKIWKGLKSEYDQLTPDSNTIYFITDKPGTNNPGTDSPTIPLGEIVKSVNGVNPINGNVLLSVSNLNDYNTLALKSDLTNKLDKPADGSNGQILQKQGDSAVWVDMPTGESSGQTPSQPTNVKKEAIETLTTAPEEWTAEDAGRVFQWGGKTTEKYKQKYFYRIVSKTNSPYPDQFDITGCDCVSEFNGTYKKTDEKIGLEGYPVYRKDQYSTFYIDTDETYYLRHEYAPSYSNTKKITDYNNVFTEESLNGSNPYNSPCGPQILTFTNFVGGGPVTTTYEPIEFTPSEVKSVNGKAGDVIIDIPSAVSQLENDRHFIQSENIYNYLTDYVSQYMFYEEMSKKISRPENPKEGQILMRTSDSEKWADLPKIDFSKKCIELLSGTPTFTENDHNRVFQWIGDSNSTYTKQNIYRVDRKVLGVKEWVYPETFRMGISPGPAEGDTFRKNAELDANGYPTYNSEMYGFSMQYIPTEKKYLMKSGDSDWLKSKALSSEECLFSNWSLELGNPFTIESDSGYPKGESVTQHIEGDKTKPNLENVVFEPVIFNPDSSIDLTNYLTFTAEEAGATIALDKSADNPSLSAVLEYDLGDGNWQNYTWDTISGQTITLDNIGDKIRFRGNNKTLSLSCDNIYIFKTEGKIRGSGSLMTLLDKTDKLRDLSGKDACFSTLFAGNRSLITAPELPATTLSPLCYYEMFMGCTSLTTAPELPATTLSPLCYYEMFMGCTSLTTAPELPATTLTDSCYYEMFMRCTSLTTAPELPATTLAQKCYWCMFNRCTGLTKVPDLPATTLADHCYNCMFEGCTSLTTAPNLFATELAKWCYSSMFKGCTSLIQAPELPATTLTDYCYSSMFERCTSLTTAPNLPATVLASGCYSYMFVECKRLIKAPNLPATVLVGTNSDNGCYCGIFAMCSNLNYISIDYTGVNDSNAFCGWVAAISSTGVFVCPEEFPVEQIPSGWTVSHKTNVDTSYGLANKVNGAGLTIWIGTQAEYDVLSPRDPNTLYMIKEG